MKTSGIENYGIYFRTLVFSSITPYLFFSDYAPFCLVAGNRCFCSSAFMSIRNKKKDGELEDIIVVLMNLISDVFWVFT
jgi:hypothetical protein